MTVDIRIQKFNDDLLIDLQDRQTAREAFPSLFHVLDYDELRTLFKSFDEPANRAKRRSLRAGIIAVFLVMIALFVASAEHLYADISYARCITIAAALLGMAGAGIGIFGVLIRRAKLEWLYQRMVGERLRQFHFQTFVCHTAEIVESLKGKTQKTNLQESRKAWLAKFKARFPPHIAAEFSSLLKNEQIAGVWLHSPPEIPNETILKALPGEFFAAYRALRIEHQCQYAEWKLRYGQNIISGFSLRSLETFLASGSVIATLGLVSTEILIFLPGFDSKWLHWIAICFAIAALGMRTLEDGLQPKRELERYQRYATNLQEILSRYDAATSPADKFEIMLELERLAFEEMRDFLRAGYESRFVI